MDEIFFQFIDAATELGKYARNEQSHSDGVSTKENAVEAIKDYGKLVATVNDKFNAFKNATNKEYNLNN